MISFISHKRKMSDQSFEPLIIRSILVSDQSFQKSFFVLEHRTLLGRPATGCSNLQACLTIITCSMTWRTCVHCLRPTILWLKKPNKNTVLIKRSTQSTIERSIWNVITIECSTWNKSRSTHDLIKEQLPTRLPAHEKRPVNRRP